MKTCSNMMAEANLIKIDLFFSILENIRKKEEEKILKRKSGRIRDTQILAFFANYFFGYILVIFAGMTKDF